MRDILFRGKRVDNGEWVEGCLLMVTLEGKTAHLIFGDNFCFVGNDVKALSHALVDPATVGQYTGMTDMTGKKVFEGDLLSATITAKLNKRTNEWGDTEWDTEEQKTVWSVEWKNFNTSNGFRVYGKDRRFNIRVSRSVIINGDCRVIGNIHDNPELLQRGISQ